LWVRDCHTLRNCSNCRNEITHRWKLVRIVGKRLKHYTPEPVPIAGMGPYTNGNLLLSREGAHTPMGNGVEETHTLLHGTCSDCRNGAYTLHTDGNLLGLWGRESHTDGNLFRLWGRDCHTLRNCSNCGNEITH
jgi:hypothetical protein